MKRENLDKQFSKFLDILKQLYINIPFTEALTQMPSYAKFLKEIMSSKRKLEEVSVVKHTEKYSAILQNKLPQKLGNPGSFIIPCTVGGAHFEKALCDSGASINLMPFSIFRKLEIGEMKDTCVSLQLADQSTKRPKEIIENVLVRVDKFVFPVDFIVLEMEENTEVPLILGRLFLATGRAIIDVHQGQLILEVDEERVIFDMQKMIKFPGNELSSSLIISSSLTPEQEYKLIEVLRKHKRALGWTIADIKGINPAICMHRILMEENYKSIVQPQRRLNPAIYQLLQKIRRKPHSHAPKRCMSAIFSYMTEKFLEIFMDDFTLFEGIVVGHKITAKGIEVDKAKIDLIAGLPPLTTVKSIRSFLGHAGTKVTVFTDHATLKYLLAKKDARPRLLRWILLLQEFDLEIKDRKGSENQVADLLSRLENPPTEILDIQEEFLMSISFLSQRL
ncbi:uncharacterized protein LOC142180904 [Nicotiana tabacum]|uniref:Uncharacterized protein LOC142180904 n=1 Tax=Nicotiana tabacum TaxID=4097 RepID=A0AC58UI07_TOBAC